MQVCFWALYSVPFICVSVLCQYLTLWITVSFFSKKKKKKVYIVQYRAKNIPLFCNNFKWSIKYKSIVLLCYIPENDLML